MPQHIPCTTYVLVQMDIPILHYCFTFNFMEDGIVSRVWWYPQKVECEFVTLKCMLC